MKAVILNNITPGEKVHLQETDIPKVISGWVLIKVKGFGLNHSEQILRLNEIANDYIKKPIIPGIECVGEIVDKSDSDFKLGQKVVGLMGGMGRSYDGSYAEYTLLPKNQVFSIKSDLSWEKLAAVSETYYTAWGSLFECLKLNSKDTLLIRGATSGLGYASIQLAKALGCKVIATTHKEEKLFLLSEAGEAILDDGSLKGKIKGVNKILELVGPKTLRDSLKIVENGGIVCHTGVLGGVYTLDNFDPIKEIPNGVYLTGFFSNNPSQNIINDIFDYLNKYQLKPKVGKSYKFENIKDACVAQDLGKVNGKIVVTI
ncbi:MAG: zinc-binding dehydrogenase [Erysipelotrichaceae bacterium]|nr:zinc-binding dehydrogenase [Erysipelotrichaceae bacterium]